MAKAIVYVEGGHPCDLKSPGLPLLADIGSGSDLVPWSPPALPAKPESAPADEIGNENAGAAA